MEVMGMETGSVNDLKTFEMTPQPDQVTSVDVQSKEFSFSYQ